MNKKKPQSTQVSKPAAKGTASGKASGAAAAPTFKSVAENRRARHNYEILDSIE
ncbi:MAG: hypothetical protein ACK6A7_20890 [Planctomycetota bacterium]